jgi:hypothetical protein
MPSYTLKDIKHNHTWDIVCSWDELQSILDEMPDVVQVLSAPRVVASVGSLNSKVPDGFKDVLNRVKSGAGKDNTIKT